MRHQGGTAETAGRTTRRVFLEFAVRVEIDSDRHLPEYAEAMERSLGATVLQDLRGAGVHASVRVDSTDFGEVPRRIE